MADYSPGSPDAPKKKTKDLAEVLRIAKKQYEDDWTAEQHNITEGYDDLRFVAGFQWDEAVKKERLQEQRIMLTLNRLPQFIRQITGDMRLNKPAIKIRPVGGGADTDTADIFTGLIRNIEAQSQGPNVYVQAGTDAARCGQGVFRINTEYADVDVFEQDIRVRYHPNGLGVLFDCNSKMPTREDAQHCFVPSRMTYDAFKEAYPKATVSSWDEFKSLNVLDMWGDPREIVVCEYWCKEKEIRTLVRMGDGSIFLAESPPKNWQKPSKPDDSAAPVTAPYSPTPKPMEGGAAAKAPWELSDDEWAQTLISAAVKTRKVEVDCVYQYHMTAAEILEVDGETSHKWAGRFIPIIPVVGEEINLGDKIIRHGAVRWAKDPQRTYNYHMTTATETHALAPKAPFVGTVEQFKGLEKEWRQANRRNLPYLRYNPDPQAGTARPERSQVSTDISASMALAERSVDDLHSTIGIYPPSLGQKSNETSGKAIIARQREADVGTYVYIDNLALAIQYCGRQLVDLIPKIYDTERTIRVVYEDDTTDEVTINKLDQAQSKVLNDITVGKYDVVVEVGPAFSTRRAEAAEAMANFVQMAPQAAPMVMDLIADSQDWPNKDAFVERFRRMLPEGLDDEIDKERAERAGPPQSNPAQELAMATGAAQLDKTRAETEKLGAETDAKNLDNMGKAAALPYAGPKAAIETRNIARPQKRAGNA